MFWEDRSVFVTGATGLLGSWLCNSLVDEGAIVTCLVRDWVPRSILLQENTINKINLVRGKVEDFYTLERSLNEFEVETVFHLAAQTIVETANRNPRSTFETNIKGTWNLLEACKRVSTVKQIVVASSDKAYGEQEKLPYDESTPLEGTHPYDVSKSCADLIAQSYNVTYGLPVSITRCGNFYGGGDLNFNRIVPDEPPIIRSDGSYVRDYFYIKDAVYSYMLLAEKMTELDIGGESFNFSNEIQVSVLELVNKIIAIMGTDKIKPQVLGEAKNEIVHQYLSAKKAKKILKWKPKYSLDEGLEETIDWYKKFFSK
ncbi:MAG: GDP-mannose 4,6-dehydratase [Candidatus Hodarchaeales archaeon]